MKYETEFCVLTPASLGRGKGLLCYNVVKCGNQGGANRFSRVVGVGGNDSTNARNRFAVNRAATMMSEAAA